MNVLFDTYGVSLEKNEVSYEYNKIKYISWVMIQ